MSENRMSTPAWMLDIFAAVMLLVAEVSAGQLVAARAWTRRGSAGADIVVARLLTGVALAGLLVSGLKILPDAAWEIVFAVITAWFVWRLWRENRGRDAAAVARGHYAPPLVHSAAMLYVFAALPGLTAGFSGMSMSGMAGGASGGIPALAVIFALLLVALSVHDLDRRAGVDGYFHVVGRPFAAGPAPGAGADLSAYTAERLLLSPAVVKGCQVTTGVAMAFTLIIMI
jgi:hypothetical protein